MKPSREKNSRNNKFTNAIKKYGKEQFYVELLEGNIPIDQLDEKEIYYIDKYDSYHNGYNSTPGGDGRIINKLNNEEELLELAKSGIDSKQLAKKFGVDYITVLRTLHKLGFYYHDFGINVKDVIRLVADGKTNVEISEIYGCHPGTISRFLDKNNIRKHNVPSTKREDIDFEKLFVDYNDQMPIKEICKKYNISESAFNRLRNECGISARKQIYMSKKERDLLKERLGTYSSDQ